MAIATDALRVSEIAPYSADFVSGLPEQINDIVGLNTARVGPRRLRIFEIDKASATTSGVVYLPNIARTLSVRTFPTGNGTATTPAIAASAAKVITITGTSTGAAAGETITINLDWTTNYTVQKKLVLTCKASGAVAADGEFNVGANLSAQLTNIVAAINANVDKAQLTAVKTSGTVITCTALVPGQNVDVQTAISNFTVATTTQNAVKTEAGRNAITLASLPSGVTKIGLLVLCSDK